MSSNFDKQSMLETITSLLGLSDKCTRVLIELHLEPNGLSALQLSRRLNLPRTSIYNYLDQLISAGLIHKSSSQRGVSFVMADTETIQSVLEEQKTYLEEAIAGTAALNRPTTTQSYIPRFSFYDEKNTAELILRDVLRSHETLVYGFWSVPDMSTVVSPELYSFFHSERERRGIRLHSLWPHNQKKIPPAYQMPNNDMLEIRTVPRVIDSHAGYILYGNKVGFLSSDKEQYGFIVDSPELSKTMKTQFQFIWEQSKKVG